MIVSVSDAGVTLLEADNFRDFKIVTSLDDTGTQATLLAGAALSRDGGAYWIRREWLVRSAGALAHQKNFQEGFAAMLKFAASRGWVDSDTGAIRAHVEQN